MNFYTILTAIGKAKLANAQITGTSVNLTQMAVGDGNGVYYEPTESQLALIRETWRGDLNRIVGDESNPNWIIIEMVIPTTAGGFTVREAGIFDEAGDMIAVGKYPETYKPTLVEGSGKDLYIRMILEVTNVSAITLRIDPAVVLASRSYVDQHKNNAVLDHPDGSVTDAKLGNRTINQALTGGSNIGTLTQILSWMARTLESITGLQWFQTLAHSWTSVFEADGMTVKEATHAVSADAATRLSGSAGGKWVEIATGSVLISGNSGSYVGLRPGQQHRMYIQSVYGTVSMTNAYDPTTNCSIIIRGSTTDQLQIINRSSSSGTFYYKVWAWE